MMRRARGFTLIEVLAAFAVLALGIAIVVSLLNGGRRQVRYAADASYAAQYAQSILDAQGLAGRLHEGESDGESDDRRVRWHLRIREIDDPLAQPADAKAGGAADRSPGKDAPAARGGADASGATAGNTSGAPAKPGAPGVPGRPGAPGPGIAPADIVAPLQLMHLQLDLEWGQGGPRERAHFSTARVQMRASAAAAPAGP